MTNELKTALENYIQLAQAMIDKNAPNYPHPDQKKLRYMEGQKYIRIVQGLEGSGCSSAWAFVEIETGNIYKAASWKVPAKHARGNIYSENPVANHSAYGPCYLR